MANIPPNAKYPDAIALAYDETNMKVTCVYNDHSLYVWDVKDIKRVSAISYLFFFISNPKCFQSGGKIKFLFISFGLYLGSRDVSCIRA